MTMLKNEKSLHTTKTETDSEPENKVTKVKLTPEHPVKRRRDAVKNTPVKISVFLN